MIKYIIDDTVIKTTATYRAYGSHKIYFPIFLGESRGTILCNAFDSANNYGVITNAHVALSGKTMKSEDNKTIGTPSLRKHTATMDAAFIHFNNASSVTWEKTEYISETGTTVRYPISSVSDSSKFVEGARVVKFGIKTGRTIGTIK